MSKSRNIFAKVVDLFRRDLDATPEVQEDMDPVLPFSPDFTELSRLKDTIRCFVFALDEYLDVVDSSNISIETKSQCVRRLQYWYKLLLQEVGLNGKKR